MNNFVPDNALREAQVSFYKEDMDRLDHFLDEFLRKSRAKSALLVDRSGHPITRKGFVQDLDVETVSALVAGSFAATREMAKLLGEKQFTFMFHQGERDNIQLSVVGERAILAVIFDDRTNLGLVRIYTDEVATKLTGIFSEIEKRPAGSVSPPPIEGDFGASAGDRLDDLFSGQ
ncbi:MAG: roadblock/LC7 domain-containing protein [Planctomycetota bacterium]